jgi:hypothetical protein
MARQWRIIIVDRSELAANMWKLLLSPFYASLIIRKRFEEARPHFFRREGVDLAIFSSNIFGKKFDEIFARLSADQPVAKAHKVFVCKEAEGPSDAGAKLAKLANSTVVRRPFHPDEFFHVVDGILSGMER